MNPPHISVLKQEVLETFENELIAKNEGILIDCTLGFGGHSLALLEKYPKLKIIGIDQDNDAIALATKRLENFKDRFSIKYGKFSETLKTILSQEQNIVGILADIGVSSMQFDNKERGFSFESETLDMRMDKTKNFNAKDIINTYSLPELERIFKNFGEIREYKKLAHCIIELRKKEKITSAKILSEFIARHFKHPKIHPATLAFQALRIEVNDELGELERLLQIFETHKMQNGARLCIISFHSLEDRIIKTYFKKWENPCICPQEAMLCKCGKNHQKGKNLYKKPLTATAQEIQENPRSRSAKLRAFEFFS